MTSVTPVVFDVATGSSLDGLSYVSADLFGPAADSFIDGVFRWIRGAVRTATGWPGLLIIAVYSFLIAFVLPLPSEVVLLAPLELGIGGAGQFTLIVLVSGFGKAVGSLLAFHLGREAKQSGPVVKALRSSRFEVVEWSERKIIKIARKWGYLGLALALSVPFFPDTISIYAFSILEEDYAKIAAATFAGSVGRLLITAGVFGGISVFW